MLPRGDEPAAAAAATMRPFGSLSRTTAVLSFEFRYRAKNARPACESNRRESTAARKIHASTSPFFFPLLPALLLLFFLHAPHCFQPSRECVSRFIAHHLCKRDMLGHFYGTRADCGWDDRESLPPTSNFLTLEIKVGELRLFRKESWLKVDALNWTYLLSDNRMIEITFTLR